MSAPSGPVRRVTHVVFDFHGGGLETVVSSMIEHMTQHHPDVAVSVISLSGRVGRVGERIRPRLDQLHALSPLPGVSMFAPIGIARAIRATRPDVVHLHSGAWLKPAYAARLARVPRVVYTEHGREHDDPALARILDRRAASLTDAVVAVSGRLGRYMSETVGLPASQVAVVPNGVDVDAFAPGASDFALRTNLGIPAQAPVVGSVGRFEAVKGYDVLLAAFARVSIAGAAPHLVLCGEGSEGDRLRRLAGQLGLAGRVHFPGWISNVREHYSLFDVFTLSSHSEGASISLLEAMASGAVPVVTDVGANAEMLGRSLSHLVVPPGDPERLAGALAAGLAAARGDGAGVEARRRVVEYYSLGSMVDGYLGVYDGRAVGRERATRDLAPA